MSEKMKLITAVGGLVLFFALAAVGYNYLSKKYSPTPVLPDVNVPSVSENTQADNNGEASDGNAEAENGEEITLQKAPHFYVYDKNGARIEFSDKVGKPIIINFWATWCGPCKMEMPHFQKAFDEYSDIIEFMMINPTDGANDTEASVAKFLTDTGYTFPVYYDKDSVATSVYGITGFPTTFFVDKDGNLLGYYPGTMNEETLYSCIDIVLGNTDT